MFVYLKMLTSKENYFLIVQNNKIRLKKLKTRQYLSLNDKMKITD